MTDVRRPHVPGDLLAGAGPTHPLERRRAGLRWPNLCLAASERRLLLTFGDLLALNAALLVALVLRFDYRLSLRALAQAPHYFLILTVLWLIWASFFEGYDLSRAAYLTQSVWSAGRAALVTALVYLAVPYVTPHFLESRLSSLIFVGLVALSVPAWRALYALVITQPAFQTRLLIVGAGTSGAELARELAGRPLLGNPYAGSGFDLVGFVDDDPALAGSSVEGLPVLGTRIDLQRLVHDLRVDTVVVAITHAWEIHPDLFRALLDCREQGVHLEPMSGLYERLTGKVPVSHVGRNLHAILPAADTPGLRLFWALKRLGDLLLALLGLVLTLLVVPFVALANLICSPGPLFYRQVRLGKGGRPFHILKLRTMIPNAEAASGAVWASQDDPRVTPVGRFLRRTRLDELPQFWNVLRGDMSLVGPRPERPEFVDRLVQQVPYYQARHAVRPGLTGWAQVRCGYGSSVEGALQKLQYDLYYIKHRSLYLELSILVKTAAVMLRFRGT